jgi:undecaprenyl-diphosphatase
MLPLHDVIVLALALVLAVAVLHVLAWQAVRMALWVAPRAYAFYTGSRVRRHALPLLDEMRARAPRLYATMAPRFSPARFSGLPLTLVVVAALYVAAMLGGLVEEVLEAEGVHHFDQAINAFFGPWREEPLLAVFLWITALGAGPTLTAVSIISTGFLWTLRQPRFIVPLWATFLGAQATTWLGKYVIDRHRPAFIEAATAISPSFPSAHATASMALYGFLAYILGRDLPSLRARFEIAFWAGVLIAAIGFSRIFLSLHYTSDVAAGFMVGVFWLLVGVALAELARSRYAPT